MLKVFIAIIFSWLSTLTPVVSGENTGGGISVTASNFQFAPQSWTASAGHEIDVTLTNHGTESHEWVLVKKGEVISLPFSEDDESKIYWEIEAEPGKTTRGTFTAPINPGTYKVVCGKKEHLEKGMLGHVIVQ